jgi:repressor LexA
MDKEKLNDYVLAYYRRNGHPPSLSRIAHAFGLASRSYVNRLLKQLVTEGHLINLDGKYYPSGIEQQIKLQRVPVLGKIAAGQPIEAIQNLEGYVGYIPQGSRQDSPLFALKVKGTSMINAGIYDGDIVIVRQQDTSDNGQIVAAMVNGEATIKRFFKEHGHYRLQPENDAMNPIIVDHAEILGIVVSSIRYFR